MHERESSNPRSETTLYAIDRTVLANERTYAAWIRTGLAALASGIALEKFMVQVMPDWSIKSIAMILVALSGVAFGLAGWRFAHLGIQLKDLDAKRVPTTVTTLVSGLLVLCSVIAFVALWFVGPQA